MLLLQISTLNTPTTRRNLPPIHGKSSTSLCRPTPTMLLLVNLVVVRHSIPLAPTTATMVRSCLTTTFSQRRDESLNHNHLMLSLNNNNNRNNHLLSLLRYTTVPHQAFALIRASANGQSVALCCWCCSFCHCSQFSCCLV